MRNYKNVNLIILTCAFMVASVMASDAFAQIEANSGAQINAANALVRDGKFTEAINAYSEIEPSASQEEQLNYNLGIAHYRNGDADAAATLFTKTAGSINQSLASNSQYNVGNCHYSIALQQADSDKPAAISNLEEAISFYRGSLRGNPDNSDARANIELAVELMKKLKDEQQKQDQQKQDQQNQDQQNQDQQNQDQQNQDQQNQDQQNQDQQDQDQQNQDQQSQDQQSQDQQNQDQSENSESQKPSDESQQQSEQKDSNQDKSDDSQDRSEQSEQDDSKSENESSKNSEQDNSDENQDSKEDQSDQANTRNLPKQNHKPQQKPDRQNPTAEDEADMDDDKNQPVPGGELEAANQQDPTEKPELAAGKISEDKDGLMTREEALKMLQSVRDRDMLRRLRQQQRERSRRLPVDRDW